VNLVLGYAGMFSLGHAGYLAIGAYTTASLNILLGMDYFLTIPITIILTAIVSMLTVLPLLRLSPFHFGLATLGMNVVITELIHTIAPKVPGAEGLFGMKLPEIMLSAPSRFAIVLAGAALCVALSWVIVRSPFGRTLRALRDRPDALESVGKDPRYYRTLIWTISGAGFGLAGTR